MAVSTIKVENGIKNIMVTTGADTINPGETKELTAVYNPPSDYPNFVCIIPQYTSTGLPIVSVWITGSPNTLHASVLNTRTTVASGETATVRLLFQR